MTKGNIDKRRILHVTWSGQKAGMLSEIVLTQLKSVDRQITVLFCSDSGGVYAQKLRDQGVRVECLNMTSKYGLISNFLGVFRFLKLVKRGQYDVVHMQEIIMPFIFLTAVCLSGKRGIVLHNRGEFSSSSKERVKNFFLFFKKKAYSILVNNFANVLIVNSNFIKTESVAIGVRESKIQVLYNAIDVDSLLHLRVQSGVLRTRILNELSLSGNIFLIGTAARLVRWKRINYLIEAIAQCPASVHAIVMGQGEEESSLVALAERLGVKERVHFLGFRSDCREVLSVLDAVALPSFEEPFGITGLEALLLKKPLFVMKDGGGLKEIVSDGHTGFVCDDVRRLTEKIRMLSEGAQNLDFKSWLDEAIFRIEYYVEQVEKNYS